MEEQPMENKQATTAMEDKGEMMTESLPETTENTELTSSKLPGLPSDESEPEVEFEISNNAAPGEQWVPASQFAAQSPSVQEEEQSTEDSDNNPDQQQQPQQLQPVEYTTLRPYVTPPTKAPTHYYIAGPGGKRPVNETTSSARPNEFYDDEIFGYDPYQTFFHGVYVPVVEVGALASQKKGSAEEDSASAESDEEYYSNSYYEQQQQQQRPGRPSQSHRYRPQQHHGHSGSSNSRPHVKHGKPSKTSTTTTGHHHNGKKPVPNLPDHLHRPRPSHLQYQHG
jgi:hypothetical protein